MTVIVLAVALLPLLGSMVAGFGVRAAGAGSVACGGALVSVGLSTWVLVHTSTHHSFTALNGFVYVDGLSAFFLFTVSIVVLLASFGSAAYLRVEEESGRLSAFQVRLYFIFFGAFAALMLGSLCTGNLGMLFVLIEASTLASTALVGLDARAQSLEAAWKYIIISSLGVTIALVGTLFLFYSGTGLHLASNLGLTWPYLYGHAAALSHASLRLAFLLAVVGYGTKVGLAPMHTWLPDAHSQAPSPASAMLSAALLNTGMYAIIRFLAIARVGLGEDYVRPVMLTFGFGSVLIGVLFMVQNANFKRLFAYSSVEHMGIIAIALGFGGQLGLYGALLHVLNHAVGKSVLFLASGDLVLGYDTRDVDKVRGVLSALPLTGTVLLLATLAVLGTPPFGLFLSELTILRAGFTHTPFLPLLLLLLLAVGFIGMSKSVTSMIFGQPDRAVQAYPRRSQRITAATPLVLGLIILLALGLWIPSYLHDSILTSIGAIT